MKIYGAYSKKLLATVESFITSWWSLLHTKMNQIIKLGFTTTCIDYTSLNDSVLYELRSIIYMYENSWIWLSKIDSRGREFWASLNLTDDFVVMRNYCFSVLWPNCAGSRGSNCWKLLSSSAFGLLLHKCSHHYFPMHCTQDWQWILFYCRCDWVSGFVFSMRRVRRPLKQSHMQKIAARRFWDW